jgi:hypothetical protein
MSTYTRVRIYLTRPFIHTCTRDVSQCSAVQCSSKCHDFFPPPTPSILRYYADSPLPYANVLVHRYTHRRRRRRVLRPFPVHVHPSLPSRRSTLQTQLNPPFLIWHAMLLYLPTSLPTVPSPSILRLDQTKKSKVKTKQRKIFSFSLVTLDCTALAKLSPVPRANAMQDGQGRFSRVGVGLRCRSKCGAAADGVGG